MNDFSGIIHIMISLAAAYGLREPIVHTIGVSITPLYIAGLALGSLLPDIDHPQASINQKVLPIHSGLVKCLVYTAAGIALVTVLPTRNIGFALLGAFFIGSGISGHRGFTHKLPGIALFSAAVWLLANTYGYLGLAYGIIIGYLLHVAADRLKDLTPL